jgi:hypothetical protein
VCPKRISIRFIARLNRDYLQASLLHQAPPSGKAAQAQAADA